MRSIFDIGDSGDPYDVRPSSKEQERALSIRHGAETGVETTGGEGPQTGAVTHALTRRGGSFSL